MKCGVQLESIISNSKVSDTISGTRQDKSNSKILFTIFVTIFIDMLGVGVLIPVYPLLVLPSSPFRVIPNGWSISEGFILLGWLSSTFPLAQFICAPILGQLADRFGRKKILAISTFGTGFGITHCLPLLFIGRMLDGCTGGNISVAQAVIADISTPKNRAKNFGLIGMAFGIGFILGPFIGGKLSDSHLVSWFSAATPFYFTAFLSLINVISIRTFLPETLKIKSEQRIDITRPFNNIIKAFRGPGLRSIMPSIFLFNAGFTFFVTFFAVTLANKYHLTQSSIGNFFAYVGIMIFCAQAIMVRRLSGRVEDYKILRFSMFGTALSLFSYYIIPASSGNLIYLIPPIMATCNALTMAFNAAIVTRVTPKNIRGESLGINSSVMAIAQAIPAILSGYVASMYPTLPILVGSFVVMLAGLCFWKLFNPLDFPNEVEEIKT